MNARPRVGFLGVGWIGRSRMAAMIETQAINTVAIADPSAEMRQEAQRLAPGAAVVDGLDGLLDLAVDGIVIATPSALHADQAIRALNAGAAVFCQKPLGRTATETRAVVDAARAADRLLAVDLSYRFTAAMQRIRCLVQARALGDVFAADLVFHNAYGPDKPWFYDASLSGGGCVIDLGVHLVDLALWTLGFPSVERVDAHLLCGGRPPASGEVEDYAVATLALAGGAVVRIACSWRLPAGRDCEIGAAFYGDKGGAALRNVAGSFYHLAADQLVGTRTERLVAPPDDWGGRAAADWARRLASGERFDPAAERLVDVADTLDRIYGR